MSFFVGLLLLVGLFIFLNLSEKKDRAKNPSKWAIIDAEKAMKDEERRKKALARQAKEDAEAMQRIPPSKWIIMSREEKSAVLKKREDAKSRGF